MSKIGMIGCVGKGNTHTIREVIEALVEKGVDSSNTARDVVVTVPSELKRTQRNTESQSCNGGTCK